MEGSAETGEERPRATRRPPAGLLGPAFEAVLEAARTGSAWAFERLWRSRAPSVATYLRLQGAADPDDLVNEVFLGVFTHLDAFEGGEEAFGSWLFTIAHRRLVDDWRRRGRRPVVDGSALVDVPGGDVEEEALRRLGEERARALCERLAPDQRDVVLLRMVAGLSLAQTAEAVGKSIVAVKALQHRAVQTLRKQMEREGVSL